MDILETTAASYQSVARLATFVQVHKPTKEAYLLSLKPKPTKNDRQRLTKEMETLRLFGEMMEKEVRLMAPVGALNKIAGIAAVTPPEPIDHRISQLLKDEDNGKSTGKEK